MQVHIVDTGERLAWQSRPVEAVDVGDGRVEEIESFERHARMWHEREAAERAAMHAPGITEVDNQITVRWLAPHPTTATILLDA